MARNDETTTKFKVDISELKSAFQEAQRQVRLANSEFKAATAGMDNWSSSADGLSAKIRQLQSVLTSENQKLENLKQQYSLVSREMGENSRQAQELQIKINNQQAVVNKTASELNHYNQQLEDVQHSAESASHGTDEMESATDRLRSTISQQEKRLEQLSRAYSDVVLEQGASSREAQELRGDISKLSSELNDNRTKLNNAEHAADSLTESFDDTENSVDKLSDGFTVMKGAMANLIADGIKNMASSLVNLASETREYREDMNKLHTAFEVAGFSTQQATDVYKDFYAVLGEEDRSVEAVNHLAKMVDSEEDLATWTDICTGVWATFGDSLPIEGLTEAANETAKVGQVTGPLADALNWVGQSEDEFNEKLAECSDEQERQKLIMETLNGIYSEAADTYRENNKDILAVNEANSNLTDSYAKLGELAEPIIASVKQGLSDLLNAAMDLTNGVDFESLNEKIKAGFSFFIDEVLPIVKDGFKWIIDNGDVIIATIAGIAAGFVAFKVVVIVQQAIALFTSLIAVIKSVGVAQAALNVIMAMNPIGLVVAAIAALVAAFVILWNKSDAFREFWIGLWEKIKEVVGFAIDGIVSFFTGIVDFFKENWQSLLLLILNPFVGAFKLIYDNCEGFRNFINNLVQTIGTFFATMWNAIATAAGAAWTAITEFFSPAVEWFTALFTSVKDSIDSILKVIIGLAKGCWTIIKRVYEVVAEWFNKNVTTPVSKFFTSMWNKLKNGAKNAWTGISNAFKNAATWFNDKIISPVSNFFGDMWAKVKSGAKNAWTGITSVFSPVVDWFRGKFTEAWTAVKNVFSTGGKIFDGIKDGIASTFKTVVNGIISGINKIISVPFDSINGMLNKIRNASFLDISPFKDLWSENPLKIPKIPLLAKGGIVDDATLAMIGEKGKEAVVPLEKNTKWIDLVASKIATQINSGASNVTSSAPQPQIYNFYQTNNSPKALSRLEIYRQTKNQIAMLKGV